MPYLKLNINSVVSDIKGETIASDFTSSVMNWQRFFVVKKLQDEKKCSNRGEGEEAAKTIIETHGGTRKRENLDYFKSQVVSALSQKMHLKCGVASKILGENSGFPLSLEAK